mgnify:CR=1 FL=1
MCIGYSKEVNEANSGLWVKLKLHVNKRLPCLLADAQLVLITCEKPQNMACKSSVNLEEQS